MQTNSSPFYTLLRKEIDRLGGLYNAHLHLDRAGTLEENYIKVAEHAVVESSHISLHEKHHLISNIHSGPAYQKADFFQRVNHYLDIMKAANTRRADTLVDVTADCVGLSALEWMQEIGRVRQKDIDLKVAAYSPLGFTDKEPQRWAIFEKGAERADFIAALPEADDREEYPDHIGFEEHLLRTLELAKRKKCLIHVHTDQRNEPSESGTERLVECVRKFGAPVLHNGEPSVWAVHMISPSTYDDPRFQKLAEGLRDLNIGVICCPSAAIGMRQLRPIQTPTYNSIPRVLELLAAGVQVRLASDNIADICSPSTTADLVDEVFMLSAALRFYHPGILAKLAAGIRITSDEREMLKEHLRQNDIEIAQVVRAAHARGF